MFKLNVKLVRQEISRRGLSIQQAATALQLNPTTARKILTDDTCEVQLKTLSRLSAYFGVEIEKLILKE